VWCPWLACGRRYCLCRACDRGHRYCSDRCRIWGTQARKRRARRKYEKTEKGRENNRKRQQRHRERQRLAASGDPAKELSPDVTDRSSQGAVDGFEWGNEHENRPNHAQILVARAQRAAVEQRDSKVAHAPSEPERRGASEYCHRCGRPGRVVRRRRPRGRFRWAGLQAGICWQQRE
jgi:hypothetical protein